MFFRQRDAHQSVYILQPQDINLHAVEAWIKSNTSCNLGPCNDRVYMPGLAVTGVGKRFQSSSIKSWV